FNQETTKCLTPPSSEQQQRLVHTIEGGTAGFRSPGARPPLILCGGVQLGKESGLFPLLPLAPLDRVGAGLAEQVLGTFAYAQQSCLPALDLNHLVERFQTCAQSLRNLPGGV